MNPANNGHTRIASVQADAGDGIGSRMPAAPWEQGLHMEALANLAHELRSPLQAILGYLDILRDELSEELAGRHKQIIDRMNANAYDLAQTVENVMDFTVADALAEPPYEEEVRPQDLIEDLAPALQAANASKGLKIRFDLESAPATFRARRRAIPTPGFNARSTKIGFTSTWRAASSSSSTASADRPPAPRPPTSR